jgi:hypothetical protein
MNARVVLCVLTGHRWTEASEIHETFPVLRCRRCGRLEELTAESQRSEGWAERSGRGARAAEFMDGRIQRRP